MSIKFYDPSKVRVVMSGILIDGFDANDILSIDFDNNKYTKSVAKKGQSCYNRQTNRGGTLTVKVLSNSKSLNMFYLAMLALDNINMPFVMTIIDTNEDSQSYILYDCMIKNNPQVSKSKTISSTEITIWFNKFVPNIISNEISKLL